jgi:hypothetical protein
MEEKDNYTKQEFEEGILALRKYINSWSSYRDLKISNIAGISIKKEDFDRVKLELDKNVEDCCQKLPKNLIDKLKIKDIDNFFHFHNIEYYSPQDLSSGDYFG